jgi:carbamate kinase
MRSVIAIGGNALLRRGELMSAGNQLANMQRSAQQLARVCGRHEVAIVHGNGPQIGLLALSSEAYSAVPAYPLDVLGAESQGMLGYIITQALCNAFAGVTINPSHSQDHPGAMRPNRSVACVLTQTRVDPSDPAFQTPSKPIGPVYPADQAPNLRARGWQFAADGAGIRRVVASPSPLEFIEFKQIESLFDGGTVAVCLGGGGIPVQRNQDGTLSGVEAVIDKDFAASLLAISLRADRLVILTDVDAVYLNWGTASQQIVHRIKADALSKHDFASGSMGPKVAAACAYVRATGKPAAIGALDKAEAVFGGSAGTQVVP